MKTDGKSGAPAPAEPPTDALDLEAIRARHAKTVDSPLEKVPLEVCRLVDTDIPALLAEVARLRAAALQDAPRTAKQDEEPKARFVEKVCPFCGEDDFDAWGLKFHLSQGGCDIYNETTRENR